MSLSLVDVSLTLGGRPLLMDLSLRIEPREVVGLLGPNGAGKTTAFNLVIGLLKPNSGEILLNGKSVANLSMPNRAILGIGYLPQEPSIFRHLTVRQNLELALSQSNMPSSVIHQRKEELIVIVKSRWIQF